MTAFGFVMANQVSGELQIGIVCYVPQKALRSISHTESCSSSSQLGDIGSSAAHQNAAATCIGASRATGPGPLKNNMMITRSLSTPQLAPFSVTRHYENLPHLGSESGYQNLPPTSTTGETGYQKQPLQPVIVRSYEYPLGSYMYENLPQPGDSGESGYQNLPRNSPQMPPQVLSSPLPQYEVPVVPKKTLSRDTTNVQSIVDRNHILTQRLESSESELSQAKHEIETLSRQLDMANHELQQEKFSTYGLSLRTKQELMDESQMLSERLSTAMRDLKHSNERCEGYVREIIGIKYNLSEQMKRNVSDKKEHELKSLELKESNQSLSQRLASTTQQLTRARNSNQLLMQQLERANSELSKFETAEREHLSHDIEPWKVARTNLEMGEEIASGGWGKVSKGKVQVAVKQLHMAITNDRNVQRLRREMIMLSQVRHPNLVQFIGAVFDEQAERLQAPPLIITELLDTNLRRAYERRRLSADQKLSIFKDVAKALKYLHERHDPIIHRDVSAPNVLLEALPDGNWKGKLTDLGSANFAQVAQTLAEGAILYAAPETIPKRSQPKLPQTPKIDVYSYGVMLCEVTTNQLPEQDKYDGMLDQVRQSCVLMHTIITRCTDEDYAKRPEISAVLRQLDEIATL